MKKIYVLVTLCGTSFFVGCGGKEYNPSAFKVREEKTELELKIEKNKEQLKNMDKMLDDINKQIEKIDLQY